MITRPDKPDTIRHAYQYCQGLARQHYENFPVASRWLPHELRQPVAAIYAFARIADDYADEGELDDVTRIKKLDECDERLQQLASDNIPDDPVYIALHDTITRHALPLTLFHDLVSAFRQDVTTQRYPTFADVLDYCRRSANPVGRLLLHLVGKATRENCTRSDNICSALQLINFYQDIEQDYLENNRIYLAQDEMAAAGITEQHIRGRINDAAMQQFMRGQYLRAAAMLCDGMVLTGQLGPRLGMEIRATIHGGLRVLELFLDSGEVYRRPRLAKTDWLRILVRTLFNTDRCKHFSRNQDQATLRQTP